MDTVTCQRDKIDNDWEDERTGRGQEMLAIKMKERAKGGDKKQ